jgi:cytochrome c5
MRLSLYGLVAVAVVIGAGAAWAADGAAVYDQDCAACHNNLEPKLGNKAAWAPLIKLGTDELVANVIKGKGAMPPRGGHPDLSDADVKAAVEYIETKSQ